LSNQLTTITDQLISLIKTQYTRFKDLDRIKIAQAIENENLGYDDCILIDPQPTETAANLTTGKIINYFINLVYFKKIYKDEITTYSNFAEALDSFLLSYIHHTSYWTHLAHEIDYNISEYIPESYKTGTQKTKLGGFVMRLTFICYKSS